MRSSSVCAGKRNCTRVLCVRVKATSGRDSAMRRTTSAQWAYSVASDLRNLRRAGVLKNRSATVTVVPPARAAGLTGPGAAPSASIRLAWASPRLRLARLTRATEAMLASASPRKPRLATRSRSSSAPILLVAWRASASGSSSAEMPAPSSCTASSLAPPCSSLTSMREAPASRLFSISSLSAEAGRSTTSPAAICEISRSGST